MHAPHYRLTDPSEAVAAARPGAREVVYSYPRGASDPVRTEHVGYVVEDAPGVWRHWKTNEASVERLFRPAADTCHDAAVALFPANDFPELCVRCGENEPTYDAAAYEQPGSHDPYDGELDDHCEDCLEAAQIDLNDDTAGIVLANGQELLLRPVVDDDTRRRAEWVIDTVDGLGPANDIEDAACLFAKLLLGEVGGDTRRERFFAVQLGDDDGWAVVAGDPINGSVVWRFDEFPPGPHRKDDAFRLTGLLNGISGVLSTDDRRAVERLIDSTPVDNPIARPATLPMLADDLQERGEHSSAELVREAVRHLSAALVLREGERG